jgi:hypothetical protein
MGILALLTIAAFTFTALDYSRAFAQNRTGKSAAAKASNQTADYESRGRRISRAG